MGLKEKLLAREATLGVIGLGYVGLPLAVEKAKAGFKVYGFDVQKEKVDMVNAGKNYIGDVVNEDLEALVKAGQLVATANFADAAKCDCVCICVPTPLDAHQQPDISYVRSSTESIMPYVHKDMLVVLESWHDRGALQAHPRKVRSQMRRGLLSCLLARARRSGQPDL